MNSCTQSRFICLLFVCAMACSLLPAHPLAALTGQWNFEGDLSATTGRDLEYLGGPAGPTAAATTFGLTSALGLPDIAGQAAAVMGFPKALPDMGCILYPEMAPNGGGGFVNQYTLLFDLLFPAASSGMRGLIQISAHA